MDIRDTPPLAAYRGIHAGETIVVCGCGPSLRELGGQTARFTTVGVNDVGRLFDPDYLVVVNPPRQFTGDRFRHVAESRAKAVFSPLQLGNAVRQAPVVHFELGQRGGTEPCGERLHFTQNSPYVAVCLAAYMGAARIALIGVDFTDDHFFAKTGKHPLSGRLAQIDAEYGALAEALARHGIELINLSARSRLTSLPKASLPGLPTRKLNIVSYATSPVAGVPVLLADCINAATGHHAQCLWPGGSYGNGVSFEGGRSWGRRPQQVLEALEAADVVIVHNGKIDPAHAAVLQGKRLVTLAHNYGWNVDMRHVRDVGMPGLVVAQYQATLPEFQGWGIVPNPIPLWQADHSPQDKDPRLIHIAYTPSGRHERYPVDHRLYWHGKGWQTTMEVLARLARRHPDLVRIDSTARGQLSHGQALAMKRHAHIVIDECVTGSYHRNSLEGLAAGAVVVNGVGLLDGVEQALRHCAPGAQGEPLPFVFSALDGLEATLQRLIEQGPAALARQGRANRDWMEKHWAFEQQWPAFWAMACGDHETSTTRPPPPPIKEPLAMTPNSPSPQAPLSADPLVSVVVPHGGSERLSQLMCTLACLRQQRGVRLEIIVVEMGPVPVALDCARRWSCLHLFIEHGGAFERARALNAAQAVAGGELLLWHDNDLIADSGFVAAAVQELRERRLDYLTPYAAVRYLSPPDSSGVMQGTLAPGGCRPVRVLASGSGASGGAGLVRRSFLAQHGGFVEGFRGWGGEDNAWNHKVALLGRAGHSRRPGQTMHHLHHASSGGPRPGEASAANPHYAANVELLRQIAALRHAADLKARFPATAPTPGRLSRFDGADDAAAPAPGLAVWAYWEGPCPAWIEACLASLRAAAPATLQVLDREGFERLRCQDPTGGDGDLDLDHLRIAHRADYIRLYLLRRFGGLWVDADCLAMQPLQPVLDLLREHETVGHRERSGLVSNGFLAARPGARIIEATYGRVCALLRSRKPLGWTSLGSEPLGAAVDALPEAWHELPCRRIQPICWSEPQAFIAEGSVAEHERLFDPDALCYMLSNSRLTPLLAVRPGADPLKPGTFFSFLLTRTGRPASGAASASLHERVFSHHAQLYRRHRDESISGPGSTLQQTQRLRASLPQMLAQLGVRSLLDAPCGDFNWMRTLDLGVEQYIGVDVLGDLIASHQRCHAHPRRRFLRLDLLEAELPHADAILCRDLLPHLAYAEIRVMLRNFRSSGAKFLLTTTFTGARPNRDTAGGDWRTLNLQLAPFGFPPPLLVLNEQCSEGGGAYADKCLAVWRLDGLPLDAPAPAHGALPA